MFNRNNGTDEQEILQNQFTAYVKRAVCNKRIRYLQSKRSAEQMEISLAELELYIYDSHDGIAAIIEKELLHQALLEIREKERYIILARVVDGKSIDDIAAELGISYRAVTSILYRGKKKLRELMEEGGEYGDF